MLTRLTLSLLLCAGAAAQDVRVLTLDPTRTYTCQTLDFNFASGNAFATVRGELLSASNFGPGGVVGRGVQLLPSVDMITPGALQGADVVMISTNQLGLRICEVLDLAEFVRQGGGLFVFHNNAASRHGHAFGASAGGVGAGQAQVVDTGSVVANGPFGAVSGSLGNLAFHRVFDDVGPYGNAVVSTSNPWLVEFDFSAGRAVLVGDEEWIMDGTVSGCAAGQYPEAARRSLFLNAFASLIPAPGFQYTPTPQSIGTVYCSFATPHNAGIPATLCALGSDVATDDDVLLVAEFMPLNEFGYFLNAPAQGLSQPATSSGTLCLAGGIGRYNGQILNTGPERRFELALTLGNTPTPNGTAAVLAGETWNFQAWFRDGGTNNFTDAVSIAFQ